MCPDSGGNFWPNHVRPTGRSSADKLPSVVGFAQMPFAVEAMRLPVVSNTRFF